MLQHPDRIFPLFIDPHVGIYGSTGASYGFIDPAPFPTGNKIITSARPGGSGGLGTAGELEVRVYSAFRRSLHGI